MKCWACNNDTASEFCIDASHIGHAIPVRFDQRYQVREFLGEGSFGSVYKCYDPVIERTVAVKKLRPHLSNAADAIAEARAAAKINHPNIVQVLDANPSSGLIVMEFAEGGSLESRLHTDPEWVKQNFDPIMLGLCSGLRAAHVEHFIHRDIKPGNVLLTADGTAKIADFGVARELIESQLVANTVAGSPPYMSLEVLLGEDYSYEADIHSLGCMMYEVWAGVRPFDAPGHTMAMIAKKRTDPIALREVCDDVDDVLSDLVARMITNDAKRRIKQVDLVAQHLSSRLPRRAEGGVRTIDEFQAHLALIYGDVNSSKPPVYLLGQYLVVLRSLINELPEGQIETAKVERLFPRAFGWLSALITATNARFGELVWLKYDEVCPYCESATCSCAALPKGDDEGRNRELLQKLMDRRLNQSGPAQSFVQYQAKFRRMYSAANDLAGAESVKIHAYSEVAEAMDALLHLQDATDTEQVTILHMELSDLIAWFFALLNCYHPDYSFPDSFDEFFGDGCYACRSNPCKCESDRGMLTWRDSLG